jgi:hypothetical protein
MDISIPMFAPVEAGTHLGAWQFRTPEGENFGVGSDGLNSLRVEFVVPDLPNGIIYDFDQVHCLAQWHSGAATFLPCQAIGDENDLRQGFVRLNDDPGLEGSSANNPPALEIKPNNQQDGWIAGFFPGIAIEDGDFFSATIGCMDLQEGCAIVFHFEVEALDGSVQRLSSWTEFYDDQAREVNVDLSEFAGERVNLVLRAEEEGSGRSIRTIGFWLNAKIVRK